MDLKSTGDDNHLSDPLFRALIEHSWDAISLVTADAIIRYFSPVASRILGYGVGELVGRYAFALIHPDDQQVSQTLFAAPLQDAGGRRTAQFRFLHRDGSWRWIEGIGTDLLAEPAVQAVVVNFRDITDRKEAEEALRESSQLNQQIIASVHEGVIAYDRDLRYVLWNPYMERLSGLLRAQVVGKRPWELFPRLQAQGIETLLRRALAGETVVGPDVLNSVPPSGKSWWGSGQFGPLYNGVGVIVGVIGTVRGISERKRTGEQLLGLQHQSAELVALLDTLLSNAPVGFAFVDQDFRFQRINAALALMNGLSMEAHLGRTVQEVVPALWPSLEPIYRRVLEKDEAVVNLELSGETLAAPGKVRHWLANYYPVKAGHQTIGLGVIINEVTEQRQAEESLQESEAFLRMSQHAGHVGSWEWRLTDNRVRWSDEMYRIHGIVPNQFDGTLENAVRFIHPDDQPGVAEGMRYIFEHGELIPGDHRIVRPDGTERLLWGMGEVLRDAANRPVRVIGTVMDVTERRQAEVELRERNAVLQNAIEGISELDAQGRYTFVNAAYAAMTGYTPEEMIGMGWEATVHAEDREKVLASFRQMQTQGKTEAVVRGVRKDGAVFYKELVLVSKPGSAKTAGGHYCFVKEITDRVRLEENLRRAQKLEALGQLAGGVAHDFNNLLTGIFGNASLLLESLPPDTSGREQAQDIERAAARAAELTQQLLGFARQAVLRLVPTDLRSCIDEAVRLLRRTIDPRIAIAVRAQADIWHVRVDAGQINQVVMNLGLNARDAMPDGGSLIVETANIAIGSDQLQRTSEARIGEFVRLRVADTGSGMMPEVRERLFEPFFTTKELGKGTGLGLSMVFGIIKQHQGWIECRSEVGRGSQFDVYLPRCRDLPAVPGGPERSPAAGGSETILLVDDEPVVRNLGRTILTRCGYQVLLAEDGQEAVEVYQHHQGRVDLVILDLTMPRLSGRDTLKQLRTIDCRASILLASGYTTEQIADPGAEGVVGFLHKPYRPQELASIVREALDRNRAQGNST